MVDTPLATFTEAEIREFLQADGFNYGTDRYNDEKKRRYSLIAGTDEYQERPDWDGSK